MVITLRSSSFSQVMDVLAKGLSTEVIEKNGEVIIKLPTSSGKGKIQALRFHSGLSLLIFEVQLTEDLIIKVQQTDYHPLRLLLCKTGFLTHSVEQRHIQYRLNEFYGALSACSGNVDQIFHLPAQQPLAIFMIEIDRKYYLERLQQANGSVHSQVRELFEDTEAEYPFLYHSPYSHAAVLVLHDFERIRQYEGIVKEIYLESKSLELLSLTLHQYVNDQSIDQKGIVLREHDIEQLVKAKRHITEHYATPPSIRELARKFGINEAKLKKGYKQLFHMTVYEHVRAERMNQAKILIAEGATDIGEVVGKVGYTSGSQFAARFKEVFGYSPKHFQKKVAQSKTKFQ